MKPHLQEPTTLAEECHCVCHTNLGVVHCTPCCSVCPHCHRRILREQMDDHIRLRHPEHSEQAKRQG